MLSVSLPLTDYKIKEMDQMKKNQAVLGDLLSYMKQERIQDMAHWEIVDFLDIILEEDELEEVLGILDDMPVRLNQFNVERTIKLLGKL